MRRAGKEAPGGAGCQPMTQGQALGVTETSLGQQGCTGGHRKGPSCENLVAMGKHCGETFFTSLVLSACTEFSLTKKSFYSGFSFQLLAVCSHPQFHF